MPIGIRKISFLKSKKHTNNLRKKIISKMKKRRKNEEKRQKYDYLTFLKM